jgi:hypothetical protein
MRTDERFTGLDWLGALVAGFSVVSLVVFPLAGRSFARMFDDFGSRENLPLLTQWATSPWGPIALAIPTGVALAFGLGASAPLRRRRAWIVGAVLLGCASCALCLVGLYLPIFVLAGAIRAD